LRESIELSFKDPFRQPLVYIKGVDENELDGVVEPYQNKIDHHKMRARNPSTL